jgi:predicted DNA-binding transcriptional regulator YafY
MDERQAVSVVYTNFKGRTAVRRILPKNFFFGNNEWHKEEQWLLLALDLDEGVERTFAVKDIKCWFKGA